MIGSGKAILEFVDQATADAAEPAQRDYDVLLERARRDDPHKPRLNSADRNYLETLVRRESYQVDAERVRSYFDFPAVRTGLLDVTGRLFGIDYRPADVPLWHADVVAYDVLRDGTAIGRIYLDLHPREGKFKHAAQFPVRAGIAGRQLPEGALVCNLPRGLMEHVEVVTLFHEFGHLVHHVLGRRAALAAAVRHHNRVGFRRGAVAAARGVGLGSRGVADLRPQRGRRGDPRRAGRGDARGERVRQGLLRAHADVLRRARVRRCTATVPTDITATVRDLQQRYDLFEYVEGTHFHASFGHLTGYSSGYYTYMWSLVIAKDLFSAFDPGDLFAPDGGTPLPRQGARAGRQQGRRRSGRRLPRPAVLVRGVPRLAR